MKISVPLVAIMIVALVVVGTFTLVRPFSQEKSIELKRFSSQNELNGYLKTAQVSDGSGFLGSVGIPVPMVARIGADSLMGAVSGAAEKSTGSGFSTTNIQVAGVDEADIVKTDGNFIYAVSGEKVYIIKAVPAGEAKVVSTIEVEDGVSEIYINKDKLIVFGTGNFYGGPMVMEVGIGVDVAESMIAPPMQTTAKILLYDISNKEKPEKDREIKVDGFYTDSRMIGDYVYTVLTTHATESLPVIQDGSNKIEGFRDVWYFDNPEYYYSYTTIISLNTQDSNQKIEEKTLLMGTTNTIFVSQDNIYLTIQKTPRVIPLMERIVTDVFVPLSPPGMAQRLQGIEDPQEAVEAFNKFVNELSVTERDQLQADMEEKLTPVLDDIAKETQKTIVQKVSIDNGKIEFLNKGEVPGNPLNQFSMDEFKGNFRIATTTGGWTQFGQAQSKNHVYVLDEGMNIVGKLEDLAPGERIFSARFLGERAYLVTFKQVDPLFVISLEDPSNPKVLGKLKIPGFSDYLHPYDEDHIIGIGKDTEETKSGARIRGVKLALFDVSDVNNPKELHKEIIGDRGTESEALRDHKAFLFDREKELLVIPITLAEFGEGEEWYGSQTFQGAYVYRLRPDIGFDLRGKVTHVTGEEAKKSGFYFDYSSQIRRSLYIGDSLYTLSNKGLKATNLDDLKETKFIEF